MKKNRTFFLFVLFLACQLLATGMASAQSIIAGQHNSSDYFFDFNPDSSNAAVHNGASAQMDIDLNGDGQNDIQLFGSNGGGLGGNSASTSIFALDSNEIAFSHYDSCFGFNGFVFASKIPRTFSLGELIDNSQSWVKMQSSISVSSFVMNSYNCNLGINSSAPVILGLRVFSANDTLYGWLKLSAFGSGSFSVAEFACNSAAANLAEQKNKPVIRILPNPAVNEVKVILSPSHSYRELRIRNAQGDLIYVENIDPKENIIIYTNHWASGLYILQLLNSKNEIINSKFIIHR